MAVVFLLPVVFSPSVHATFWTPAAAICVVVAAVGVVRLVPLSRTDARPAARAGIALLGVAFVSAVLSDNPTIGFLGLYGWGTGWLFVAACVGAWAIGRSLDERGRDVVERALLWAALLNSAVAVLEAMVDLEALHLGRFGSRSPGLLGNPVHLGGFAAAAVALAVPRLIDAPRRWAPAVVLLAAGVQTAGGRSGIVVLLGVLGWVALSRGWRAAALVAALSVAGFVVGGAAASAIDGGSQIASERVTTSAGEGFAPRLETWKDAAEAVTDRPLVGHGPGQFRTATSPLRDVSLARSEGPDKLFVDAHNILVEYGVTTGVLGLAVFAAFLLFGLRDARGPMLVFVVAELANHLVEPQAVRTTPVVFLALGAAAVTTSSVTHRLAVPGRVATGALAAAALVAAGLLLVGDFHLEQARLDFDLDHAERANDLLPWPESADVRSRALLFEGRVRRDPAFTEQAIESARTAVERDQSSPQWWIVLGYRLTASGDLEASEQAFREAIRANPMSTIARNGLARVALLRGDHDGARRWALSALRIRSQEPTRELLAEIDESKRTREGAGP